MTRRHPNQSDISRRTFIKGTAIASTALVGTTGLATSATATPGTSHYLGQTGPGAVYHHRSDGWTQLGRPLTDREGSVTKLRQYDGDLFVGVTTHTSQAAGTGRLYRLDGSGWTLVGDDLDNNVCTMAVYDGDLYVGTSHGTAKLYRYDGPNNLTQVLSHTDWDGISAGYVWDGKLFLGDSLYDKYGYYDGSSFTVEQPASIGSCVYDFVHYDGDLYGGNFAGVLRRREGGSWPVVAERGDGGLLELATHDGELYAGQQGGTLYRWDGATESLDSVHEFADSVVGLTAAGDALYVGIGQNAAEFDDSYPRSAPGELYRYQDGTITQLSADDEFGNGVQVLTTVERNESDRYAVTQAGDLTSIAADGGGVTDRPPTAVSAIGTTSADFDTDSSDDLVFLTRDGQIGLIDSEETEARTLDIAPPAKTSKTHLTTGRWAGSDTSIFYVAATGNGDEIYRVAPEAQPTSVANPANGVDAVSGIADIDGDGTDELVFADGSQAVRYVRPSDGTTQRFSMAYDGAGSNNNVGIGAPADFTGDGTASVPIVDGSNQILLVGPDGIRAQLITGSDDEQAAKAPLCAGDVDSDGELEVVYIENASATLKYVDDIGSDSVFKTLRDANGNRIEADTERGVVSY